MEQICRKRCFDNIAFFPRSVLSAVQLGRLILFSFFSVSVPKRGGNGVPITFAAPPLPGFQKNGFWGPSWCRVLCNRCIADAVVVEKGVLSTAAWPSVGVSSDCCIVSLGSALLSALLGPVIPVCDRSAVWFLVRGVFRCLLVPFFLAVAKVKSPDMPNMHVTFRGWFLVF